MYKFKPTNDMTMLEVVDLLHAMKVEISEDDYTALKNPTKRQFEKMVLEEVEEEEVEKEEVEELVVESEEVEEDVKVEVAEDLEPNVLEEEEEEKEEVEETPDARRRIKNHKRKNINFGERL
jgi:hypothetical protein